MIQVLEKVWPRNDKVPKTMIAYAMGVAEGLLSPEIDEIQVKESAMVPKIRYYLANYVGF